MLRGDIPTAQNLQLERTVTPRLKERRLQVRVDNIKARKRAML